MTPDQIWSDLESDAQTMTGAGILKRMLGPDAACTIFLGVQRPSLSRLFLLQVPRGLLPSRDKLPESRGFELSVMLTGEEPDTHATIALAATDRQFNEIFSEMAANLYSHLKSCRNDREIMQLFVECLMQWQEFFDRIPPTGLSEEAQRGLYGELYLLKNHLLPGTEDPASAVTGWTGPLNRQHDFQFGETVIEVKTSNAKQHQKITVSSEQQLDESLVTNLFVFHLSLSSVENHQSTLFSLVSDIRNLLQHNHGALLAFNSALLKRGYLETQAWRYQRTGYAVREANMFRVTEEFPHITERDLPPGVGDLSYTISVSECKRFSLPIEGVIELIRKGMT